MCVVNHSINRASVALWQRMIEIMLRLRATINQPVCPPIRRSDANLHVQEYLWPNNSFIKDASAAWATDSRCRIWWASWQTCWCCIPIKHLLMTVLWKLCRYFPLGFPLPCTHHLRLGNDNSITPEDAVGVGCFKIVDICIELRYGYFAYLY